MGISKRELKEIGITKGSAIYYINKDVFPYEVHAVTVTSVGKEHIKYESKNDISRQHKRKGQIYYYTKYGFDNHNIYLTEKDAIMTAGAIMVMVRLGLNFASCFEINERYKCFAPVVIDSTLVV